MTSLRLDEGNELDRSCCFVHFSKFLFNYFFREQLSCVFSNTDYRKQKLGEKRRKSACFTTLTQVQNVVLTKVLLPALHKKFLFFDYSIGFIEYKWLCSRIRNTFIWKMIQNVILWQNLTYVKGLNLFFCLWNYCKCYNGTYKSKIKIVVNSEIICSKNDFKWLVNPFSTAVPLDVPLHYLPFSLWQSFEKS